MTEQEIKKHRKAFEFVRLCARSYEPDDAGIDAISHALDEGQDWRLVELQATFHRVHPLVFQTLKTFFSDRLPPAFTSLQRQWLQSASIHNVFLIKEHERIIKVLDRRGIPALNLKGPVLSQIAYGNYNLRHYRDLDVLIPEHKFEEAQEVLLAGGYQPAGHMIKREGMAKQIALYLESQYAFERGNVFGLDLHTRLLPPFYSYSIDFDHLLARSIEVDVAGARLRSLSPEDMLIALCFQGAKDRWEVLKLHCDVAELVRSHPELDWQVILARTRSVAGERIVNLGLYFAHHLLGAPVPEPVLASIREARGLEKIAERLADRLPLQMQLGTAPFLDRVVYNLMIQDSVIYGLRYSAFSILRNITTPFLSPFKGNMASRRMLPVETSP